VARLLEEGGIWSREDRERKVLVRLHALPNEEACRRCLGGDHAFRGVVMTSVSLREIEADVAASRWQSLAGFALTMLLVCLVLLLFFSGSRSEWGRGTWRCAPGSVAGTRSASSRSG
jgi:hypothetical protein